MREDWYWSRINCSLHRPRHFYPDKEGYLRNQFHVVSKYEMQGEIIKLQYTIENEINPDRRRLGKSIHSLFHKGLPEETLQYIDDVRLFVFDMRRLPGEVRERFQSDMRIVQDYLVEVKDSITSLFAIMEESCANQLGKN